MATQLLRAAPTLCSSRTCSDTMLAAVFLGLGFVTKMLQAWIVIPVFALAYAIGSATSLRRRILDLLGAGMVLVASSLWWVALVSTWPGPKPYFGGSTDGSVLNLVIGYNGMGRILGRQAGRELLGGVGGPAGPGSPDGGSAWVGGHGGGGGFGGGPGHHPLVWRATRGPDQLAASAVPARPRGRHLRGDPPEERRGDHRADVRPRAPGRLDSLGDWLIMVGLVLSAAQSGFRPYYTTEMAPAAGVAAMWRCYRRPAGYLWLLFPAAVTLSAGWAWVLVSRDTSWQGWLRYAVATVGILAVLLLVAGRAQGPMTGDLTTEQRGILAYAQTHADGTPITLAVEGGARAAETYLLHSNSVIVGMGGFSGQDPAPTVITLAQWIQQHQLRYVLLPSPDSGGVIRYRIRSRRCRR